MLPKLWLVARATLDTTEHVSPNYYSPQVLQEYQVGADYTLQLPRGSNFNIAYLPGYGKEKTSDGVFINEIDATLNLALTRSLTLTPAVELTLANPLTTATPTAPPLHTAFSPA